MEIALIFVIIGSIIYDIFGGNKKIKKIIFIGLFVFLTIASCLRAYSVGTDTGLYYSTYNHISEMSFNEVLNARFEIGYSLLCKLLGIIFKSPQIIIIVSSILLNFAVYRFINNNTKNKLMSAILYVTLNYYFCYVCLVRQGIALAFVLFALDALKNGKNKWFFLDVLFASSFHISALAFIVVFFLRKKNTKNLFAVTAVGSLLAFLLIDLVVAIAMNVFGLYEKYSGTQYLNSSYISAGLYSLSSLAILAFGLFVPKKDELIAAAKNKFHSMNAWILAIGTVISFASIKISILNRIYLYFGFFGVIWLANALFSMSNQSNNRGRVIAWKVIIYSISIVYVCTITRLNWFGVVPYKFFWEV